MNNLYIIGLACVLFLFLWKKYTLYTKRRNEYIKILQEQNKKLEEAIQQGNSPHPINSMPHSTNGLSQSSPIETVQVESVQVDLPSIPGITSEIAAILKGFSHQRPQEESANVEEVTEEESKENFVDSVARDASWKDINDVSDDDIEIVDDTAQDCVEPEFETPEDPEKVPLPENFPDREESEPTGRCQVQPLLEENFADVPEELYDRPSTRVSENDDSGVVASNTDDNRMYLDKDEELEETLDELIQTKQMHCTAILSSGKNKGSACGKKAKKNGLCKVHSK